VARVRRWWRKQARRKLGPSQVALLVAGLLVVAAGATFVIRRQFDRRELVLAVMPFRNTSADPEDTGYIGEALGSELTARLGRMGGFRVLPWETTARFGASKRSFTELGHDLGADLLLVGHYAADGERISVGLELVEGRRGLQRWSDRLQSTTRDLALMQNDLAGRIARQLAPSGDKIGRRGAPARVAQNPDAYEAYLRGVNAMHSSSLADRALAEPMFRHALDLDSTYAEAWVGLGAVLIERYYQGGRGGLADLKRGQRCFEQALVFDPGSGPAIRGLVRVFSESESTSQQALALADSAGPRVADEIERQLVRGWACMMSVLPEEAVDAFDRVLTLDPHNQAARYVSSFTLWWAGRLPDAVETSKAYVREFGEDPDVYAYCGVALAAMGRYDEAKVFLRQSVNLFSGSSGAFAVLYYAGVLCSSGEGSAANGLLDDRIPVFEAGLAAAPDNLRLRTDLANLYAARGDMAHFEAQWSIVTREVSAGASGSGGEYCYTPFVLAQMGELTRAKQVLLSFRPEYLQASSLLPANVGMENVFRGGRSAELASSPELIQMRAGAQSLRATLRKRYPWLVGATEGPLTDERRTRSAKSAS
jgi:TolB-like protein/tetratricopeptide (TPR) repeat protein